jgi:hypothetical protein
MLPRKWETPERYAESAEERRVHICEEAMGEVSLSPSERVAAPYGDRRFRRAFSCGRHRQPHPLRDLPGGGYGAGFQGRHSRVAAATRSAGRLGPSPSGHPSTSSCGPGSPPSRTSSLRVDLQACFRLRVHSHRASWATPDTSRDSDPGFGAGRISFSRGTAKNDSFVEKNRKRHGASVCAICGSTFPLPR